MSKEQFEDNELLIDSVMFRLIQISANADRLTPAFKARYAEIPWHAVRGLRNRIVHEYGHVDLSVVFDTVMVDLPLLLREIEAILNEQ